ncbi:MAG: hypothetical protein LBU57_02375 [Dysgonamonadaceae bacterium]|jgi:PKD repeat protein|nr:hypothetical protein [Dysgonamonadaceae bacterium]
MKNHLSGWIALAFLFTVSCYEETRVEFIPDFDILSVNENYSVPSEFTIVNKTVGADRYLWTFEGGIPAVSTQKSPGSVIFREPGAHLIRLECWLGAHSKSKELELKLDSVIYHAFEPEIQVNAYAPVYVKFINKTQGATRFEWTFEGGSPASSVLRDPPPVCFEQPGKYAVQLISGNDRKQYKSTDTITVLPRLQTDFVLKPSLQDEDFEAPAVLYSENKSISNLRSKWTVSNEGSVKNDTATHAEFYLESPGSYTITLHTDNDKEKQTLTREISILPNTNLYTLKNIKFGVASAETTGAFFSSHFKKVFLEKEIDQTNGKQIDFIFFVLNEHFNYCRLLSPDQADEFVYSPIAGAIRTFTVNELISKGISFSVQDFDSMTDDSALNRLEIRKNDTGDAYFKLDALPYIVLFETIDGRKGAVCVREIQKSGKESYLIADIKVQKNKTSNP